MTIGVANQQGVGFDSREDDYLFSKCLSDAIVAGFNKEPDVCTDGGNDKHFFTIAFRGVEYFVAENEVGGLTVMRPDEY